MARMRMALGTQLAQAGLWVLLIGGPLLLYSIPVLELVVTTSGLFSQYQDIYIAGQPLEQNLPQMQWQQLIRLPAVLLLIAVKAGPAMLLGAGFSIGALEFSAWLLRRRWPNWALWQPAGLISLVGYLLGLLWLAYGLGSLAHLLLPVAWFNLPDVPAVHELQTEMLHEEYLWPFALPGAVPKSGWVIYNSAVLEAIEFQPLKASSIKLGALLATLLYYRRSIRRTKFQQLKSAKSI